MQIVFMPSLSWFDCCAVWNKKGMMFAMVYWCVDGVVTVNLLIQFDAEEKKKLNYAKIGE